MTRKEQIIEAGIEYTMQNDPVCIGGDNFYEISKMPNRNKSFEEGAKWADENPHSQYIAEYLYKEKGYPISLNGEIPTFEETMKDLQTYNDYKAKKLLEKACKWLLKGGYFVNSTETIDDFKRAMEEV